MKDYDIIQHVTGKSQFIDDINVPNGTLFAKVFYSKNAHAKIISLDLSEASLIKGVVKILTYKDIPGVNQVGGIILDEPLLAEDEVHFIGMPVALIIAETMLIAREASDKIRIEYESLPVIIDPRDAFSKGQLSLPPRIFESGNINEAWEKCEYIETGTCETGGQEHLYLETHGSISIPQEGGKIKIISSTQSPTAVQRVTSGILGIPKNMIEVEVLRLGGGFGGKEDQASHWAALSALAAAILNRPVKLVLSRHDDMVMTGKRNPFSSDFKIGLNKEGKILAYEVTFYQNSGAAADLSPAILDRALFHCTNSYFVPNVKAIGYCCKTNLTPNTAFRGFGGPQGKFVMESAIYKAALKMNIDPFEIQKKNLLKENEEFHYGQKALHVMAEKTWDQCDKEFNIDSVKKETEEFNSENNLFKKGFAVIPICFGIAFTNTRMNQANALVNVYTDGSVGFSTAAVEMGQGVNAKIREVISRVFSISHDRIRSEASNTTRSANTSPTAASSGADLNCNAVYLASNKILERLLQSAAEDLGEKNSENIKIKDEKFYLKGEVTDLNWNNVIENAYSKRISLCDYSHYATPELHFDNKTNKGNPFRYHVYGTAIIEVTVDCLRGIFKIDSVKAVHDFGSSLNSVIDLGQAEGALIQGLGWMTIEEVMHDKNGKLLTDLLSTYKVPDVHFAPKNVEIRFLNEPNPVGIFNSKAIGEPPLMYGIGVYFALLNAVREFNPDADLEFNAPFTPEKVLLKLYEKKNMTESKNVIEDHLESI
ncbi:MAG: molybdopterin cofactor-binding domain-containing protein [Ignavibacteria bacterium]